MANVQHASLTDPELHEPKGASTASSGEVYVSDGAGSGDWLLSEDIEATKSLDTNGYVYLPGGVLMQWGSFVNNSDSIQTITFPIAFTNYCAFANITQIGAGSQTNIAVLVSSISKTSFQIDRDNDIDGSQTLRWFAVGY